MTWKWVSKKIVLSIHDEQILEHGGLAGLRDEGLLDSALARPIHRANYEAIGVVDLAAVYGHGIARNHPFLDGNKRTAFVVLELFLFLNGFGLIADDANYLERFLSLAEGSLSEKELGVWLKDNTSPIKGDGSSDG